MHHDFIYFDKDESKNNVPLLTGGTNELNTIFWPDDSTKKLLEKISGKSFKKLFVTVDSVVYSLKVKDLV